MHHGANIIVLASHRTLLLLDRGCTLQTWCSRLRQAALTQ